MAMSLGEMLGLGIEEGHHNPLPKEKPKLDLHMVLYNRINMPRITSCL